jgi:hypothetical protein
VIQFATSSASKEIETETVKLRRVLVPDLQRPSSDIQQCLAGASHLQGDQQLPPPQAHRADERISILAVPDTVVRSERVEAVVLNADTGTPCHPLEPNLDLCPLIGGKVSASDQEDQSLTRFPDQPVSITANS